MGVASGRKKRENRKRKIQFSVKKTERSRKRISGYFS